MSSRRETTRFFFSLLILMILKSKVWPTKPSRSFGGLTSICEDGMKASTPTETIRPPLTTDLTRPWTMEPSWQLASMLSHLRICWARSKETVGVPSLFSSFSR